jgi:hypothetical protein
MSNCGVKGALGFGDARRLVEFYYFILQTGNREMGSQANDTRLGQGLGTWSRLFLSRKSVATHLTSPSILSSIKSNPSTLQSTQSIKAMPVLYPLSIAS